MQKPHHKLLQTFSNPPSNQIPNPRLIDPIWVVDEVQHNARMQRLFDVTCGAEALSKEEESVFCQQIEQGEWNLGSIFHIWDLNIDAPQSLPPLSLLLNIATRGERIVQSLLDAHIKARGELPSWLLSRSFGRESHFMPLLIHHPYIEINQPIGQEYGDIVDTNHTLADECMDSINGKPIRLSNHTPEQATSLLLDAIAAGAVLKPDKFSWIRAIRPNHADGALDRLAEQWQQEWNDFSAGKIPADALTSEHISHFYAMGHLEDCLNSPLIRNHEMHVLGCASSLPEWAFDKPRYAREIGRIVSRNTPNSQVQFITPEYRVESATEPHITP